MMEIKIKDATLEAEYRIVEGEPEELHDGRGLGHPGTPDQVEVSHLLWTDGHMLAHDVTDLISDLNLMEEVESAIENKLN